MHQKVTYSALLGQVLANLRKQRNIEQSKIAERMGLTQASYSRLESGKSSFSIDQVFQAADALEINAIEVIEELDRFSKHLKSDGIELTPKTKKNSSDKPNNESKSNSSGAFVAGAALGALLIHVLSKK